jgi:hypothetical protein
MVLSLGSLCHRSKAMGGQPMTFGCLQHSSQMVAMAVFTKSGARNDCDRDFNI